MHKLLTISFFFLLLLTGGSCKKYLDQKPDKSFLLPNSIENLQAILDNNFVMNQAHPGTGESSADNYFFTELTFNSLPPYDKNLYLWDTAAYSTFPNAWALCYQPVYSANLVLDNIDKIEYNSRNVTKWSNVKGSALFYRANSFLIAAWNWTKSYDAGTAAIDAGIPLRVTEDFNIPSKRANVEETYNQIIGDLMAAVSLLPNIPVHVLRPSRGAAYALLARTYLSMRQYDSCLKYANLSLQVKSNLLDYNNLQLTNKYPIPRFNEEVIFSNVITNGRTFALSGRVDTVLYQLYDSNDLRKDIFFIQASDSYYTFRGSYDGILPFAGIATDEIYLMRAECNARAGNVNLALDDLNKLLQSRFKTGTYTNYSIADKDLLLEVILKERRKELLFRDLRWMDIKRLNKENNGIILKRIIGSQTFTLQPNASRFALPLPLDLIIQTGMEQNPYN